MRHRLLLTSALFLVAACGSSVSDTTGTPSSSTGTKGATSGATGGSSGTSGQGGAGGAGGSVALQTTPPAQYLPKATGPCPAFAQGKASFTPDGKPRDVLLWVDPAKAMALDGPLVFVWHGAGGDPTDTTDILGSAVIKAVTDLGGVVAAPYHDPVNNVLPWYLTIGGNDETDLRVADEILACAVSSVGVDMRRIHSVGFSAGAMNTEQFAARRSGYLASIVAYSGARLGSVTEEDEGNKYPAMLFYGGANDMVIVNFAQQTQMYHDALKADGHFSFLCNHNLGHTVPADGPPSAWKFLQDHPFGTVPEPYVSGLPAGFPKYCML